MSDPDDNDQPQNPEPRAWVVRAGREGEEEQYNLDHSVVSIGWYDFEELDSMTDREEFGERLEELYPEGNTRSARDQLWRFAKEISIGDFVVMPQKRPELGRERLIAIGRAVGPYEWDPTQPESVRHRRKVEWLQTDLPREVVEDDLDKSLNGLVTIYSLKPNDAPYRIRYLAEHGEDPGDRNSRVDNGQRETWDGRLEEYLDDLGQGESPRTIRKRRSIRRSILSRWIDFAWTASQSPIVAGPLVEEFLSDLRDGDLKESTRQIIRMSSSGGVPTGTIQKTLGLQPSSTPDHGKNAWRVLRRSCCVRSATCKRSRTCWRTRGR